MDDHSKIRRYCFISGCYSGQVLKCKEKKSVFHASKEMFDLWAQVIPLKNEKKFTKYDGICEKHFKKEDVIRGFDAGKNVFIRYKRAQLSKTAIPCIFFDEEHQDLEQNQSKNPEMVKCEVIGCENTTIHKTPEQIERENDGIKINFFRFPQSEERRKLWISALQRVNWNPDEKSVICSDHFSAECFERTDVNSYIMRHAVPSIFPTEIKPDVNFEFIPFTNPNDVLRINKDTLGVTDPLNTIKNEPDIKLETKEIMETETVFVKEEPIDDRHVTCDSSAQTMDSVQMDEMMADDRLEEEEEAKMMVFKNKIKTLEEEIKLQDIVIQNLEEKINEIRGGPY